MTHDERNAFENLLLMCPNHSRMIDYLAPDSYSVERLQEMKQHHETRRVGRSSWATDDEVGLYALQVVMWTIAAPVAPTTPLPGLHDEVGISDSVPVTATPATAQGSGSAFDATGETTRNAGLPDLVLREDSDGSLNVINRGSRSAYAISVDAPPGAPFRLAMIPPGVLDPGDEWRVGHRLKASEDAGPHRLTVQWSDALGETYEAVFELS